MMSCLYLVTELFYILIMLTKVHTGVKTHKPAHRISEHLLYVNDTSIKTKNKNKKTHGFKEVDVLPASKHQGVFMKYGVVESVRCRV